MSAAVVKRSANSGIIGGGGGGSTSTTAPSSSGGGNGGGINNNTKRFQHQSSLLGVPTTATTTAMTLLRKDPAALLARGYTARYIGAVLHAYNNNNNNKSTGNNNSTAISNNNNYNNNSLPSITTLSNEEMDRDFRHICAYQEAATRYHQLTYAATNNILLTNVSSSKSGGTNSSMSGGDTTMDGTGGSHGSQDGINASAYLSTASLPVRIDPEEEKRRITAQKRIQRAEAVREELEQHYVALRAHYVVTTQELQSLSQESERTIETLQQSVTATASVLGYQRAKLQMTRDVAAALQYRTNILLTGETGATTTAPIQLSSSLVSTNAVVEHDSTAPLSQSTESLSNNDVTMTATSSNTTTNTSDHQFPLLAAWTTVEEECKRHLSNASNGKNSVVQAKGGKGKQAAAAASTTIPWSCTMEPSTPFGIPMLLSIISTVPEKSIAIKTGNMFGSTNPHSLTWMESHLPSLVDEDGDDLIKTELEAVETLRTEVATLEEELLQERQLNQEILVKTGQSRIQHDEWVAMIALVRQETEAVLHRHNVLLESDEVRDAIANMVTVAASSSNATDGVNSAPGTMATAREGDDDEEEEEEEEDLEDEEGNFDNDNEGNDGGNPDGMMDDGNNVSSKSERVGIKSNIDEEGASEADDEGMEEEGEEVDDWDTTAGANNVNIHLNTGSNNSNTTNKRSSGNSNSNEDSEGSPGGSRKRRKV